MPIYEFECEKCKKQFEVVTLSLSEKPKAACPACKSKKTRKMISRVSKGKYSGNFSGTSAPTGAVERGGFGRTASSFFSRIGG